MVPARCHSHERLHCAGADSRYRQLHTERHGGVRYQDPNVEWGGKEATLVTPVVCSLVETVALIPAVTLWQRMVTGYDEQCREEMEINTFTCIKTGSTYTLAIAAIPFAAVTYVLWRLSHSYYVKFCSCCTKQRSYAKSVLVQEAKRDGKIADGFTLAAKTGTGCHYCVCIFS